MTSEIDEQIKQLVTKRKQLVQQQTLAIDLKLVNINNEIQHANNTINEINEKIKIKNNEIYELEKSRKQYLCIIFKLNKQKCPIIGHEWDYDWERHDEGGGLFEHCVICGAPRLN